jgi:1,4-alpha-glucan branching enzyme
LNLPQGYFNLVLHAHLPFVRHPEHEFFQEENWLFESITETYIPLLLMFRSWERERIPFKLTLSLTPTLLAMLNDPLLQERYLRHLRNLKNLAEKELTRTSLDPNFHPIAKLYYDRFVESEFFFENECQCHLIPAFKHFQDSGFLEIITCAATHAFLPLLNPFLKAVKAQIQIAIQDYKRYFDRNPSGIWLPECGYFSGLDEILAENGI